MIITVIKEDEQGNQVIRYVNGAKFGVLQLTQKEKEDLKKLTTDKVKEKNAQPTKTD